MRKEFLLSVKTSTFYSLCLTVLLFGFSCEEQPDLEPFRELARNADCADIRNQLFLIDNKMVFWHRQGNCPDNRFAQILFGETPEEELCSRKDSIAGPQKSCKNKEFIDLFETILDNLNEEDLGLSPDHQVDPISF